MRKFEFNFLSELFVGINSKITLKLSIVSIDNKISHVEILKKLTIKIESVREPRDSGEKIPKVVEFIRSSIVTSIKGEEVFVTKPKITSSNNDIARCDGDNLTNECLNY